MASKNVNWMGIIGLIGSILMIVGVFLTWATMQLSILGFGVEASFSGLDVFNGTGSVTLLGQTEVLDDVEFEYAYAPIVCLVAGIIALITTIVPIVYNKNPTVNRVLGAVSLILAIVAIILAVMFTTQMDSASVEDFVAASLSAGAGVWVSIVGGVILAIGGIVDIAKKYVIKDGSEGEPKDDAPSE